MSSMLASHLELDRRRIDVKGCLKRAACRLARELGADSARTVRGDRYDTTSAHNSRCSAPIATLSALSGGLVFRFAG